MGDDLVQFIPSSWHGKLVSLLSILLTCTSFGTRYYAGQSITDLGETDKSWECVWAVGKVQDRQTAQKAKRLSQSAIKCLLTGTQKQMWFDVIAASDPHNRPIIHNCVGQPVQSLKTWTAVQTSHLSYHPQCPACSSPSLRNTVLFGWVPPTPRVGCKSRLPPCDDPWW